MTRALRPTRTGIAIALVAGAVALVVSPGNAHKPITSPFTYNDDVFPVLRDRCGRCHVEGGVAPMSLMTHQDTVPWGESIRVELLAGRMPPGGVDSAPGRFRNVQPFTAREMNVLLTWATGGTPFGNPDKTPPPVAPTTGWPLGPPDLELPVPTEFTLPADAQESTAEFVIPTGTTERRWLRAVDLLPGTPSIVRAATVRVRSTSPSTAGAEPVLAVWLPGDDAVALDDNAAFELPAAAELVVSVHYKKTWQYERKEMRDRSRVGLYFATGTPRPVRALTLMPEEAGTRGAGSGQLSLAGIVDENVRVLAIYPGDDLTNVSVVVNAVEASGSRQELIAFHPHAGWARRFWFREPIALARGARIQATIAPDDESPLLPLAVPVTQARPPQSAARLTVNVVAAR